MSEGESMFKVSETVQIMRGLHKGQSAEVIYVDEGQETYAVKFVNGAVDVINWVNVKTPVEPTIGAGALATAIGGFAGEFPAGVLEDLEKASPGITAEFYLVQVVS